MMRNVHFFLHYCMLLQFIFITLNNLNKTLKDLRDLNLINLGFPGVSIGEEFACSARDHRQPRRPGFDPWVGKIP